MIGKIILAAIVIVALYWGFNNFKVDTMDICMSNQEELLPITCEFQEDCVMYLTSAYVAGYPRTELFQEILTDTTSCNEGHCYLKSFDFKDNLLNKRCESNTSLMSYKVTGKDIMAIKG